MNEQRKLRSELHDFLHQGLMQLYMSYTSTVSTERARELVLQELDSMRAYFSEEAGVPKAPTYDDARRFWLDKQTDENYADEAPQHLYTIDQYEEMLIRMKDIQQ